MIQKPTHKFAHGDTVSAGSAANDPALLTRKQLAKKLGLSTRSIDNLQKRRALPVCKISARCCRYSLEAVLRALGRFTIEEVK